MLVKYISVVEKKW